MIADFKCVRALVAITAGHTKVEPGELGVVDGYPRVRWIKGVSCNVKEGQVEMAEIQLSDLRRK